MPANGVDAVSRSKAEPVIRNHQKPLGAITVPAGKVKSTPSKRHPVKSKALVAEVL
jgi:hypothetical protein